MLIQATIRILGWGDLSRLGIGGAIEARPPVAPVAILGRVVN